MFSPLSATNLVRVYDAVKGLRNANTVPNAKNASIPLLRKNRQAAILFSSCGLLTLVYWEYTNCQSAAGGDGEPDFLGDRQVIFARDRGSRGNW